MATLVFDIETVGEDFDALDETSQDVLTRWIKKESGSGEDYTAALADLKNGMGFSPLTGQIVAIGIRDVERGKGAVYFQPSLQGKEASFEEDDCKFEVMTEKAMLQKFWEVVEKYDTFVTFNGRAFDVPFLMVRSAILGIRPSKNLLANRYLNYHPSNARHIDLIDQLTFYGAMRKRGSLHLWCRAFGIESPKAQGVDGDDVKALFEHGKSADIARYNARDLTATAELYRRYLDYLQF
ncbi:MAG: ribonuclease H-like domain-containing protein [Candidatus Moranbacteria bacterium]|jgi:DNA polymerase elongation subunit (family B)|nr:ribonuclease H-like domain-containing protein [Candidatus Moranbacteria bacterium]